MSDSHPFAKLESATLSQTRPTIVVDTGAMLVTGAPAGAISLASDLILHLWWPTRCPIDFGLNDLLDALRQQQTQNAWNLWHVRRYRAWAQVFFEERSKDRWDPSPSYYRLTRQPTPVLACSRASFASSLALVG